MLKAGQGSRTGICCDFLNAQAHVTYQSLEAAFWCIHPFLVVWWCVGSFACESHIPYTWFGYSFAHLANVLFSGVFCELITGMSWSTHLSCKLKQGITEQEFVLWWDIQGTTPVCHHVYTVPQPRTLSGLLFWLGRLQSSLCPGTLVVLRFASYPWLLLSYSRTQQVKGWFPVSFSGFGWWWPEVGQAGIKVGQLWTHISFWLRT